MSNTFLAYRNGGETDEEGVSQIVGRLLVQGSPTNYSTSSMQVLQHAGGANMSVDVQIGDVVIPTTAGTYCYNGWTTAVQNLAVTASSPSNPRIDTAVAYVNLAVVNNSTPNNPGALAFAVIAGTAAASPVAPSGSTIQAALGAGTPWTPLANLTVGTSVTSIVNANIADTRYPWAIRANLWGGSSNTKGHIVPNVADDTVALLNATQTMKNKTFDSSTTILSNGWQPDSNSYTYSANNGNKEFVVTPTTTPAGYLQAGTKVSYTRGTVPPTQCMSFAAASSQYAFNASPAGITFTGPFTCEAWIYLNSYTGNGMFIMERENGTSGWGFNISSTGQVNIYYGAGSSFTNFTSYQSVPLGRWVHIAGAVTSVSSKTAVVYIDGLAVPSFVTGTATTLVQPTANLQVGAYNTPNQYFDGYISEPRIWSAARTAAQIQANQYINITTTTTNLVFGLTAGTFTDMSGNANNLTAAAGASPTQAANPFNAIEYFYVLTVSPTSVTLKGVSGGLPNETLTTPRYSYEGTPFGWPSLSTSLVGHKLLWLPFLAQQTTTNTSTGAFGGSFGITSWNFTVPSNCSLLRIGGFVTDLTSGSANTAVLSFWNSLLQVGQLNQTSSNEYGSPEILVPVTPGSSFQFSIGWSTTGSTATWNASATKSTDNGFWIEPA